MYVSRFRQSETSSKEWVGFVPVSRRRSIALGVAGALMIVVGGGLSNPGLWGLGVACLTLVVIRWLVRDQLPSRSRVQQLSTSQGAAFAGPASVSARALRSSGLLKAARPSMTIALAYIFGGEFNGMLIVNEFGISFRMPSEAKRIGAGDINVAWSELRDWRVAERPGYLGDPGYLSLELLGGRHLNLEARQISALRDALAATRK